MTKRLIAAAALLLFSLLLSIFSVGAVHGEICRALAVINNNDDIYIAAQGLLELRADNEKIFSVFLKHTDADTIDRLHIELKCALENNNDEKISLLLAEIYAFLTVADEGEIIKTENIF